MKKESEQNIRQLQVMEMNLQNLLLQKRNLQVQLLETENALRELNLSEEAPYKIINNIMIRTSKEKLTKELDSKKEMIDIKLKSLESQETDIMEKASRIQEEVLKEEK